ncbi:MAG: right-handed parallel beta-helix repeat-containing protein, partial [Elusimicrobiota bacterium]|nr:right-handed parallel beta-helix repeat-containing protein [Elusimicrobiota bacterium]
PTIERCTVNRSRESGIYVNTSSVAINNNSLLDNRIGVIFESSNCTLIESSITNTFPAVDGTGNEWVFIAGTSCDVFYFGSTYWAYEAFKARGVPDSRILFMADHHQENVSGTWLENVDIANENVTKANLLDNLTKLPVSPQDELWIFLMNHGGVDTFWFHCDVYDPVTGECIFDDPHTMECMYYSELAAVLGNINCSRIIIVIEACYAATAIDDLKGLNRICVVTNYDLVVVGTLSEFWRRISLGDNLLRAYKQVEKYGVLINMEDIYFPYAIISDNSYFVASHCEILQNHVGIKAYNSTLIVNGCNISYSGYNSTGGAIFCNKSALRFTNNSLIYNYNDIYCEHKKGNIKLADNYFANCFNRGMTFFNITQSTIARNNIIKSEISVIRGEENCIRDNNTISESNFGLKIEFSQSNVIEGNTYFNNNYGSYISYSSNNTISNYNKYLNNTHGLCISNSPNNTISNYNE